MANAKQLTFETMTNADLWRIWDEFSRVDKYANDNLFTAKGRDETVKRMKKLIDRLNAIK